MWTKRRQKGQNRPNEGPIGQIKGCYEGLVGPVVDQVAVTHFVSSPNSSNFSTFCSHSHRSSSSSDHESGPPAIPYDFVLLLSILSMEIKPNDVGFKHTVEGINPIPLMDNHISKESCLGEVNDTDIREQGE